MKMKLPSILLSVSAALSIIISCGKDIEIYPHKTPQTVNICLLNDSRFSTKSIDPDEEHINDINLFLFDEHGNLEETRFFTNDDFSTSKQGAEIHSKWISGKKCQAYACVNFGYQIIGISTLSDLIKYRYHMAYPDEYSRGIPMSGKSGIVHINEDNHNIIIGLERMMAKISVSIDRRKLNPGVKFIVKSINIGGSPKSANAFSKSNAKGSTDIFSTGFTKSYAQVDDLNIDESPGISREVDLYMLENMQGDLLPDAKHEKDKILSMSDVMAGICSFIEIAAEYNSGTMFSRPDEYLIYRFYLGDSPKNFDVERNCHYNITVTPEGDGLQESSWRIDKTGLSRYGKASITVHPGNYIEGKCGDTIHVTVDIEPDGIWFEFGKEELEYDKNRGIYDYEMDKDGHGVTLTLKNKGSGILYIEAGSPVSDTEMVYIEVN